MPKSTNKKGTPTMAAKETPARFMMIGKGKVVHVVRDKRHDLRQGQEGSQCPQVRKAHVAGKIKPPAKDKGISIEAASALDPCQRCDTSAVIKAMTDPKKSKAERQAKSKDKLEEMNDMYKSVAAPKSKGKSKTAKATKGASSGRMTKTGPLSVGDERQKAQDLVDFAKQHGWTGEVKQRDDGIGLMAEVKRGQETIRCYFADGKYDHAKHAEVIVGSWVGRLRAVHACRRQISMEGRDRPYPNPGVSRSNASRKVEAEVVPEDESPEDARKRVPFSIDDDALAIIDAVKGKTIRWRNGLSGSIEEARLPSVARPKNAKRDIITIADHPATGKRIIEFLPVEEVGERGEVYGGERFVSLEKILRVVG